MNELPLSSLIISRRSSLSEFWKVDGASNCLKWRYASTGIPFKLPELVQGATELQIENLVVKNLSATQLITRRTEDQSG